MGKASSIAAAPRDAELHHGHRQRLRARFLEAGPKSLADYELLEVLLFAAHPRGDVRPLAKRLIKQFGDFGGVLRAETQALRKVEGLGEAGVAALKAVEASTELLLRHAIRKGPVIQSWSSLLDYCKVAMAGQTKEQFRILFLDQKNRLIADEVQQRGTVDHTPVYPREVLGRALELSASAVILVHNHPSGDPTPSKADIEMTNTIVSAARPLGIRVHDHLIIGGDGHYSFKSYGLI